MSKQSEVLKFAVESMHRVLGEFCVSAGLPEPVLWDEGSSSDPGVVNLIFLGLERRQVENMMNRIQVRRGAEDGKVMEVLARPPVSYSVRAAVVLAGEDQLSRLASYGELLMFLRELPELPVGDFDWVGNGGRGIPVTVVGQVDSSWSAVPERLLPYRAFTAFLRMDIGIDAAVGDGFVRVRERQFSAAHKNSGNKTE